VFVVIDSAGVSSAEELFPVMGVFHLRGSDNQSPLELHTAVLGSPYWRYLSSEVGTSN
jgi:hypothetical protein